jgi:DNA-binding transcriptional LysR family regulator
VTSRIYGEALPASLPMPLAPDDLLLDPCIVYTASRTRNAWNLTGADGVAVTVSVRGTLQTNNSVLARASVLSGTGISLVPTCMFREELASAEVTKAVVPEKTSNQAMSVAGRAGRWGRCHLRAARLRPQQVACR